MPATARPGEGSPPHFNRTRDNLTHRCVAELRRDINNWVEHWNQNPRPFIWRKTADEILDNLAGYLHRINNSRH